MRKASTKGDKKLSTTAAQQDRWAAWLQEFCGGMSDKAAGQKLGGVSPATVKHWRTTGKLPGWEHFNRLKDHLGDAWAAFIVGYPADWQSDATLEARIVAVEASLHRLRAETRRAKESG